MIGRRLLKVVNVVNAFTQPKGETNFSVGSRRVLMYNKATVPTSPLVAHYAVFAAFSSSVMLKSPQLAQSPQVAYPKSTEVSKC